MGWSLVKNSLILFLCLLMLDIFNNKSIKKGFTLIEIIVVLIVVMALLGIVLRSSNNFARNLEFKNQKEEFSWLFHKLVATAISSNRTKQWAYTGMQIIIKKNSLTYTDTQTHNQSRSWLQFKDITIDGQSQDMISLFLIPYQLGCRSNTSWSTIQFKFSKNNDVQSCFRIDLSVCKLSEISCLPTSQSK